MKSFILLSALAMVCSTCLFLVIAFFLPSTLLKTRDYSLNASNAIDLAALKQSYDLLTKTVAISQDMAMANVRIAIVFSFATFVLNASLSLLILYKRKRFSATLSNVL